MKTKIIKVPKCIKMLFCGFPGRAARGHLGWSSVILIDIDEKILVDTGDWGCRHELVNRLEGLNLRPDDISKVILTHIHQDHVANLSLFKKANVVVSKKAIEYASKYDSDYFIAPYIGDYLKSINERLILVDGTAKIHKMVQIIETSGHTPDSISCIVNFRKSRAIIVGDAIKNAYEYISEMADETQDNEASKQTIRKIKKMAEVVIIPGHDRPFYSHCGEIFYLCSCEDTLMMRTNPFSKEWTTVTVSVT